MTRLISILIILFFSCGSATTPYKDTTPTDTTQTKNIEANANLYGDTLRDPNHYYYLSDLPLRKVAQLILTDSIQPLDNKITFDCMDSLSSTQADTRQYYFPVFLKILDKSDGALAEAVGQYAMSYVKKYPGEFAEKSLSITDDQFKSWASNTGYELYFTYETEKKAKGWVNSVIKGCSACDTAQLKRLEGFNKLAIAGMKDADED